MTYCVLDFHELLPRIYCCSFAENKIDHVLWLGLIVSVQLFKKKRW
jgi:hypothetical protein